MDLKENSVLTVSNEKKGFKCYLTILMCTLFAS